MKAEEFDTWAHYTNYVRTLQRTSCCCHNFLKGAGTEPGFCIFRGDQRKVSQENGWKSGEVKEAKMKLDSLEALGGGFNITLKTLQDQEQRKKLLLKFVECAEVAEDILRVWKSDWKG